MTTKLQKLVDTKQVQEKDVKLEQKLAIVNHRLEGETFEEYKRRRKIVNFAIKEYRKGKMFHVSSVLIPKIDEKGNVVIGADGRKPIWIGTTKGRVFINENKRKDKNVKKNMEKNI